MLWYTVPDCHGGRQGIFSSGWYTVYFRDFFSQKLSCEGLRVFSSPLKDYVIVVVLVTQSCPTLPPHELQPTRLLCPCGQETRRRNSHSCSESQEEVQKVHESLTQVPLKNNTDPNRKRYTLHLQQEVTYFTTFSRRKKKFLLAGKQLNQSATVTTQPMKINHTVNSQFPPVDILFITAPPNFSFSKKLSSHSFYQT